jgi:hypothetical protein
MVWPLRRLAAPDSVSDNHYGCRRGILQKASRSSGSGRSLGARIEGAGSQLQRSAIAKPCLGAEAWEGRYR